MFTTTLVQASDYSTSGNWLLTISATADQTAAWVVSPAPFSTRTLYCDVKLSSGSDVLPPAAFVIEAVGVCTP